VRLVLWQAAPLALAFPTQTAQFVFLLGLLTKRHANRANVVAMTASAVAMAALLYLSQTGRIGLGWSWLIPPYHWRFDARAVDLTRAIIDALR
jgi:hypothetical protein